MNIEILSAGAAKGLVRDLEPTFREEHGVGIAGTFGAVGAMLEKLIGGAPCDVIILTEAQIRKLGAEGRIEQSTVTVLGDVPTAIAVCADAPTPRIGNREELATAISAASAVYLPDPDLATAGIHFMGVLRKLGLSPVLRPYPNGAEAMRAMALSRDTSAIGCTQATEILYTQGVTLIGALPDQVGLLTSYAAAVVSTAANPGAARAFLQLLSSPTTAPLRAAAGFGAASDSISRE